MNKTLTLHQRCSPNLFTEQLTQQQLYIWLIAKLFKLFRSVSTLSKLPNLPTPMSTLSTLAETRMDKGFDKDVHMIILDEHLDIDQSFNSCRRLHGPQGKRYFLDRPTCGCHDREFSTDLQHATSFLLLTNDMKLTKKGNYESA